MADPPQQAGSPAFVFATCQVGAERALKAEVARARPAWRFAYSRPGFLTFKVQPAGPNEEKLQLVFARTFGGSLGELQGDDPREIAKEVWRLVGDRPYDALHVWQRDLVSPGHRAFEPGITELARQADAMLLEAAPAERASLASHAAQPGDRVLDCVLVEPHEWWIGEHVAGDAPSCWPGGIYAGTLPEHAVSRAYLKMQEALAWSKLPIESGQKVAEIGCAPGGSCQALLERGLHVVGIDPAEVDERVLSNANFTHVRKRGAEVRRREFHGVRWLVGDMNVAPCYTLDTVEAIVTHPSVNVRGLLLVLKLLDWKLADELPAYLARVASWGYPTVLARQLSQNRQDLFVAART